MLSARTVGNLPAVSVIVDRMNILSIQSHVAYGHVGNDAAVFPLQRMGVEVWPIHTVQFSNHTGYGSFTGRVFDALFGAAPLLTSINAPEGNTCALTESANEKANAATSTDRLA